MERGDYCGQKFLQITSSIDVTLPPESLARSGGKQKSKAEIPKKIEDRKTDMYARN